MLDESYSKTRAEFIKDYILENPEERNITDFLTELEPIADPELTMGYAWRCWDGSEILEISGDNFWTR
jgi:hypothetical protein